MTDKLLCAFESLEIPITATFDEAKLAYRDLALVWHPDRHQGNERLQLKANEKLKEINGAWEIVKAYFSGGAGAQSGESTSYSNRRSREETRQEEPKKSGATMTCPHCGKVNNVVKTTLIELAKCSACDKYLSKSEEMKEQARQAEFNKRRAQRTQQRKKESSESQEFRRSSEPVPPETESPVAPAAQKNTYTWKDYLGWIFLISIILKFVFQVLLK